ncbi:MAG TPA: PIN domain-containing protein [Herpetosiphonaceae bacterium]|nr:PIN domain-containing protein [Herpetosiphonaceae bacterium]
MSSFGAVLDASVLFPAAVRDTPLRAAGAGLYQLYWSADILEEVRRNLVKRGRATEEQAQRLVDVMQRAFPEPLISGYEALMDGMSNDPKDRHG